MHFLLSIKWVAIFINLASSLPTNPHEWTRREQISVLSSIPIPIPTTAHSHDLAAPPFFSKLTALLLFPDPVLSRRSPQAVEFESTEGLPFDPTKVFIPLTDIPAVWRALTLSSLASMTPFRKYSHFDLKSALFRARTHLEAVTAANGTLEVATVAESDNLNTSLMDISASNIGIPPSGVWTDTLNSLQTVSDYLSDRQWDQTVFGKKIVHDIEEKDHHTKNTTFILLEPRMPHLRDFYPVSGMSGFMNKLSTTFQTAILNRKEVGKQEKVAKKDAKELSKNPGQKSKNWIQWNGINWKMFSGVRKGWERSKNAAEMYSSRMPDGGKGRLW